MIMLLPVVAITLLPSRAAAAPADPPTLTDWQASFHRENKQTAALAAGRARPSVLAVFSDAAVPPLLGSMGLHSLAALTGEELLAAFTRELAYAEVLHGFQASVKAISQAAAGGSRGSGSSGWRQPPSFEKVHVLLRYLFNMCEQQTLQRQSDSRSRHWAARAFKGCWTAVQRGNHSSRPACLLSLGCDGEMTALATVETRRHKVSNALPLSHHCGSAHSLRQLLYQRTC